jgi:predicted lipid carrier protein YhbT
MTLPRLRRRPVLPRPIHALVRNLPRVPSAAVVAAALNLLLGRRLPAEAFERLGARPFSIEVRDLDLVMTFRHDGRRFVPVPSTKRTALRFRIDAADFAPLAMPESASDVLFLHDFDAEGDPRVASLVREALTGLDVRRTRRLFRRAARRAASEATQR